jgi:hypothetical protein
LKGRLHPEATQRWPSRTSQSCIQPSVHTRSRPSGLLPHRANNQEGAAPKPRPLFFCPINLRWSDGRPARPLECQPSRAGTPGAPPFLRKRTANRGRRPSPYPRVVQRIAHETRAHWIIEYVKELLLNLLFSSQRTVKRFLLPDFSLTVQKFVDAMGRRAFDSLHDSAIGTGPRGRKIGTRARCT